MLSPEETRRYARHLVLRGIGGAGQQKLKAARVLVVGAGGLGSPVIAYLAAAGIGTLGIVDDDRVTLSNLQRQIVHTTARDGALKTESAARFVGDLNPHVTVETITLRLTPDNSVRVMAGFDLVVEGSDSFATRSIVAEAARVTARPLVSGAVSMFDGQVTVFTPGGPRFRDLYPTAPDPDDLPNCEAVGVIGTLTGVIGTLMAMEAIKLVTGLGEPLIGRLLLYDARSSRFTELEYGGPAAG